MKWGVPAYQRTSVPAVSINTPARTRIYFRKLLARWHAGTLARWHTSHFLFPLHALPYTYPKQYLFGVVWTCLRPAGDPR